ncbi:MAG: hypothetical protein ACLTER_26680 [Ruminococcus sp.]
MLPARQTSGNSEYPLGQQVPPQSVVPQPAPKVENGFMHFSDKPGTGAELVEGQLSFYPYKAPFPRETHNFIVTDLFLIYNYYKSKKALLFRANWILRENRWCVGLDNSQSHRVFLCMQEIPLEFPYYIKSPTGQDRTAAESAVVARGDLRCRRENPASSILFTL